MMQSANDKANFDDPIEARRFIRGWCNEFQAATGKVANVVHTNAGEIRLDKMTDEEAIFVAKDLNRSMST